jgi:hypothetical protein
VIADRSSWRCVHARSPIRSAHVIAQTIERSELSVAVLGIALVALGEPVGEEMVRARVSVTCVHVRHT